MEWNTIIKLLLIILFSVHICYNFSENFTTKPINWRDTSLDNETNNDDTEEGPKIEEKYMKVAEKGYDAFTCYKCGSNKTEYVVRGARMAFLTQIVIGFPLWPIKKQIKCFACGSNCDY